MSRFVFFGLVFLSLALNVSAYAAEFGCVAWYTDVDGKVYRKLLEQQPYDKDYYEVELQDITYGMLFSDPVKFEPGFIIYDNKTKNFITTDSSMRRVPNTLHSSASAHYYRYEGTGKEKRIVAQLTCWVDY
jgi:hypothetical protein